MSTNFTMDGISTMDTGSNTVMLQMNTESIAEVKLLVSGYQAEYGRSSGLQIMAVTKSGTNQFRGSVYDVERNSDWNANSKTNILNGLPKTVSKQQDWGYSIGGPIGKPGGNNKLFFFNARRVPAAHRRQRSAGLPRADRARAAGRLLADARQQRQSVSLHQGSAAARAPAPRRARRAASRTAACSAGSRRPPLPAGPEHPQDVAAADRRAASPGRTSVHQAGRGQPAYQPAIRFDYQALPSLRVSYKYQGQIDRQQVNQGTIPGWNDTVTPYTGVARTPCRSTTT